MDDKMTFMDAYLPRKFNLTARLGYGGELVSCARDLSLILTRLGELHSVFSGWQSRTGFSGLHSSNLENAGEDELGLLLTAGRLRTDVNDRVISELGYSANLWNANTESPMDLRVTCGRSSKAPGVKNSLVLRMAGEDRVPEVYTEPALTSLADSVIRVWRPERLVVTSRALRESLQNGLEDPDDSLIPGVRTFARSLKLSGPVPPGVTVTDYDQGVLLSVDSSAETAEPTLRELMRLFP